MLSAPNAAQNSGGGPYLNKNKASYFGFKLGKYAFIVSLITVAVVIAMSVIGFFMPFIKISMSMEGMSETMLSLSGLDLVKMLFKGISEEDLELYLIRKQIYAVAIGYLLLLPVCLIILVYTIKTMGDYNKKHTFFVFVLNTLAAAVSLALMIAFFVLQSKLVEAGVDEFLKTYSFTVVMAIVVALIAIINLLMYMYYNDNQQVSHNSKVRIGIVKRKEFIVNGYFFTFYAILAGVLVGVIISVLYGNFKKDSVAKLLNIPVYQIILICGVAILVIQQAIMRCVRLLNPKYDYTQNMILSKKMGLIQVGIFILSFVIFFMALRKNPFNDMDYVDEAMWRIAFDLKGNENIIFSYPVFIATLVVMGCSGVWCFLMSCEYLIRKFFNSISYKEDILPHEIRKVRFRALRAVIPIAIFISIVAIATTFINLGSGWSIRSPEITESLLLMLRC